MVFPEFGVETRAVPDLRVELLDHRLRARPFRRDISGRRDKETEHSLAHVAASARTLRTKGCHTTRGRRKDRGARDGGARRSLLSSGIGVTPTSIPIYCKRDQRFSRRSSLQPSFRCPLCVTRARRQGQTRFAGRA